MKYLLEMLHDLFQLNAEKGDIGNGNEILRQNTNRIF